MHEATPLQVIHDAVPEHAGVQLLLKRDDLAASPVTGNKARKLKYNLLAAREQGQRRIATFGGAYSNHIYAMAAAGKFYGFATYGFIRGEETLPLNPILRFAVANGMRLFYVDRETYRSKDSEVMQAFVRAQCGECYLLPEGGTNALAVRGCEEIVPEIDAPFDVICCAAGTGGTLAGIVRSLPAGRRAIGFSALKGGGFLYDEVSRWLDKNVAYAEWSVAADYHFGGYAKTSPALLDFIAGFTARTGVPLDAVYTGKMMFGLYDMIARGDFARGATVVAVHTGGYYPPGEI